MRKLQHIGLLITFVCLATGVAKAQSFQVQCPTNTITHPDLSNAGVNNSEPAYTGPTYTGNSQTYASHGAGHVNGAIKCQQISGGDGFATMGDGTQTYMFSFGPLSGLANLAAGLPGTGFPFEFNPTPSVPLVPGDPATTGNPFNGAVGLAPESYTDPLTGNPITVMNGHVDPRPIMDVGVMNGNIPAPLMAIDEDDEFFLTLTNVGQVMRPDLFEQHTVHFHGYPNASAFYDGVPDASVAINIGGSFTYYYLAPDAGTYFWHCHITPPEHLQMGMVGQLYVRPRQNRGQVGPMGTQTTDGANHFSQPLPSIINMSSGQRALLRISDLDVTEYQTLASLGIRMHVIGYNAKLLRDQAGNNLDYYTNSITLAGGESLDVILDSCAARASDGNCTNPIPSGTYYLYTPNLDHLSNDAENFGGLMTEVHIN